MRTLFINSNLDLFGTCSSLISIRGQVARGNDSPDESFV